MRLSDRILRFGLADLLRVELLESAIRWERASLLTGQYETRTGVHNAGPLDRVSRETPLVVPQDADVIDPAAVTLAENLRRAGYVTAHFGKFDVTARHADILNHHGFDYNFGGSNTGVPGSYFADYQSAI